MKYRRNQPSIHNNRLRKVTRKGNIVSMQTNSFDTDHFKLKDLGKIVANTVISPVKAIAGTATKIVGADKANEKVKAWGYNNAKDFSNEKVGKVGVGIQKGTDIAGKVALGAAALVGGVKGIQAIKAAKTNEVTASPIVKSMTPTISPLQPSVKVNPSTPIDEPLARLSPAKYTPDDTLPEFNGIAATSDNPVTSSGVIDKVISLGRGLTPDKIQRGKDILTSGKGILSDAQKEFAKGQTDPSRLPKTKALKEAEQALLLPQFSGVADVSSTLSSGNMKYIIVAGVVVVIGLLAYFISRK